MGVDETSVIPLKLRWPSAMFTLREIFYNGKIHVRRQKGRFGGMRLKKTGATAKFCGRRSKVG